MNVRAIAAAAALLALAGCGPKFTGPEEVKGLRVLAVQAEPPEIGAPGDDVLSEGAWPGAATGIHALIGHPDFATAAGDRAVVLHLACTPTPGDLTGTVCSQMSALSQPAVLLEHLSTATACPAVGAKHLGVEGAITVAGLEACGPAGCQPLSVASGPGDTAPVVDFGPSDYELPTRSDPAVSFLAGLPAGHEQRLLGTDVVVLSIAVEGAPAELAPSSAVTADCPTLLPPVLRWFAEQWSLRPHVASLKWIHVRGPEMPAASPPNQNPTITGLSLGGTDLPALGGAPAAVPGGKAQPLLPHLSQDAAPPPHETYQRYDTDGKYVDSPEEDWAYSWFTTAGELKHTRTQTWDEKNDFTPKRNGDGSPRSAILWVVVRDLRGGEAWTAAPVQAQ